MPWGAPSHGGRMTSAVALARTVLHMAKDVVAVVTVALHVAESLLERWEAEDDRSGN